MPAPEALSCATSYHAPMVHAFIMVKTGAGESEQLIEPIRGLGGVVEAHIVAGA